MYEEVMKFQRNKDEFMEKSKEVIKELEELQKVLKDAEIEAIMGLYLPSKERKQKLKSINKDIENINKELEEI